MTQLIFINSRARRGGSIHDFSIGLEGQMLTCGEGEVVELELMAFSCKQNFYNIQTGRNNAFTLTEDGSDSSITLTPGNYDVLELATEIQTQLNASLINYTIVVSYSAVTGKLSLTRSLTGSPVVTTMTFTAGTDGHEILGFAEGSTVTIEDTALVSDAIISVGNEENLYLHLSPAGRNLWYNTSAAGHGFTSVMAKIPILSDHFGTIYWENIGGIRYVKQFLTGYNANSLHFRITNEHDLPIELQADFSMTFELRRRHI